MTKMRIGPNNGPHVDIDIAAESVLVANEHLAEYAHEAWSGWMKYLFENSLEESDGVKIPRALVERWQRQMNTPYEKLPEHEKVSDRAEALKMQAIFFGPPDIDLPEGG